MSTVFAIQLLDAFSAILMETAVTAMGVDRANIFRIAQHTRAKATNLREIPLGSFRLLAREIVITGTTLLPKCGR